LFPGAKVNTRMRDFDPDAIHIATEGPLGMAARRFALAHNLPFTTAYHTRFPEYVKARTAIPLSWTYAFLRWFHGPSQAVMAPTAVVKKDLETYGFTNVVLWSRGVDLDIFRPQTVNRLNTTPPIFLYVGRVAVEKNIGAFLELDLPGSKWVAGDGPALAGLKSRHPEVNYLGVLNQQELAEVYASASVFVFPSKTDTFGLVLLEAMGCGLPVAAYPVTGPLDVIGSNAKAGAMHEDLRTACMQALELKREDAAAHAQLFSWRAATEQFLSHLHPRQRSSRLAATMAA
jgi:glycosyltransferase involved in cell wall biosynthesis